MMMGLRLPLPLLLQNKYPGRKKILFAKKTYKLGDNPKAWHYFVSNDFTGLVIEGNGATLLCPEANLGFHFNGGR
jgi:hypothetical protein